MRTRKHRSAGNFIWNLFFNNDWRRSDEESDIAQAIGIVFDAVYSGLSDWKNQNWQSALNKALYAAHVVDPKETQILLNKIQGRRGDETWDCLEFHAKKVDEPTKIIMVLNGGRLRVENDRQSYNRLMKVFESKKPAAQQDRFAKRFEDAQDDDKDARQAKAAADKKSRDGQKAKRRAQESTAAADDSGKEGLTHKLLPEGTDQFLELNNPATTEEAPKAEAASPAKEPVEKPLQGPSKCGMTRSGGLDDLASLKEALAADADDSPAEATATEEVEVPDVDSVTLTPVEPPTAQDTANAGAGQ